jgi:hypothetical protein
VLGDQPVNQFPAYCGIWGFITVNTTAHQLSILWSRLTQSKSSHPVTSTPIPAMSSHLCPGLTRGMFPRHMLHAPPTSSSSSTNCGTPHSTVSCYSLPAKLLCPNVFRSTPFSSGHNSLPFTGEKKSLITKSFCMWVSISPFRSDRFWRNLVRKLGHWSMYFLISFSRCPCTTPKRPLGVQEFEAQNF